MNEHEVSVASVMAVAFVVCVYIIVTAVKGCETPRKAAHKCAVECRDAGGDPVECVKACNE